MRSSSRLISADRSIIVAADVGMQSLVTLLRATCTVPGIGAYKLGFRLGFEGLANAVREVRAYCGPDMPVIYDHQKAGNDIPAMGIEFAKALRVAGVNAAILFPFAGPATQEVWTRACFDEGVTVLTGGMMTHPKLLVSEGGYLSDDAPERIFRLACKLGVRDFVVPGNNIHWVEELRNLLEQELGADNFVLYAPGFITQGGDVSECGKAVGPRFHAIVGSGIYGKQTEEAMREAAFVVCKAVA